MSLNRGIISVTRWPDRPSASESAVTTSARPPVCAYGCASDATITMSSGEAPLPALFAIGTPVARGATDRRALDVRVSVGSGAGGFAAAGAGAALPVFAVARLRALGEDAGF